jgi:hypothetical protein
MIVDTNVGRGLARHVAAAARLRLPLVIWGLEQRERATGIVDAVAPAS